MADRHQGGKADTNESHPQQNKCPWGVGENLAEQAAALIRSGMGRRSRDMHQQRADSADHDKINGKQQQHRMRPLPINNRREDRWPHQAAAGESRHGHAERNAGADRQV